MPVFKEASSAARHARILPSRALPLPRLSPRHDDDDDDDATSSTGHHEVVVIGAGPSGLFLTLLLARYGITNSSLLCLDAKPGPLQAGQADGLQPRTLEVLQSLGIAQEILAEGCRVEEVAFWNPVRDAVHGIERTSFVPDVDVPARFPFEVAIHQGRIERILDDNLGLYAPHDTVRRAHRFLEYEFDDGDGHADFPILVKYEHDLPDGTREKGTLRTKYLVGADGARSLVRRCMRLQLEGETSDDVWGVCDFVADTDFPDIRKRCAVHSHAGSVMVIPREQIATGDHLTRLYVQVGGEVGGEVGGDAHAHAGTDTKTAGKKRRDAVSFESILAQAQAVLSPYSIKVKHDTAPDWWAAYQIGQRMTPKFSARTSDGVDRVFIVGDGESTVYRLPSTVYSAPSSASFRVDADPWRLLAGKACHTHSPKAGQGMNVSMMDAYNLSWKLAHSLLGLTPSVPPGTADAILATFEAERVDVARQLIAFDTQFSNMFSGKIGPADGPAGGLTHDEFLRVFRQGSSFTSGCGLCYKPNRLVRAPVLPPAEAQLDAIPQPDSLAGALTPGRRLLNVQVKRYADASTRHLQDEMPSTGRYHVLLLASNDLLDTSGASQSAIRSSIHALHKFPAGAIHLVMLHPLTERFEWADIPPGVKTFAEMRTYGLAKSEDAYDVLGVSKHEGILAVTRPDGYVGMLAPLTAPQLVEAYFRDCLVGIEHFPRHGHPC